VAADQAFFRARLPLPNAQVGRLFFGAVEPIGQHKQAQNDKHDDQDMVNLHGASLSKKGQGCGLFKVGPSELLRSKPCNNHLAPAAMGQGELGQPLWERQTA
jgi:hypothetical protein